MDHSADVEKRRRKGLYLATIPLLALATSACVPTKPVAEFTPVQSEIDSFTSRHPVELRPWLHALYEEGERNAVLNFNRLGLAAMSAGMLDYAHYALNHSYRRIETIYADNDLAKKARSNWSPEEVKDFKGEPYERSMTYYYLGLTYLARGEFDNARASFLGAARQDRYAEGEEHQDDFGIMEYLAGFSSLCRGDRDDFDERIKVAAGQHPEGFAESLAAGVAPGLLIFEAGEGPEKRSEGQYQEVLRFVDPEQPQIERVLVAESEAELIEAANITYQATTRGGRAIDAINNGKAEFKEGAEGAMKGMATAAAASLAVAQMQSNLGNRDAAGAAGMFGLVMLAGSLVADQVSKATTPAADTRSWQGLPRSIHLTHWQGERLPEKLVYLLPPAEEVAAEESEGKGGDGDSKDSSAEKEATAIEVPIAWKSEHPNCSIGWSRQPDALPATPQRNLLDEDLGSERGPGNVAFRKRLVAELEPMAREPAASLTAEIRGDQ